jgi:hypothetical protein
MVTEMEERESWEAERVLKGKQIIEPDRRYSPRVRKL